VDSSDLIDELTSVSELEVVVNNDVFDKVKLVFNVDTNAVDASFVWSTKEVVCCSETSEIDGMTVGDEMDVVCTRNSVLAAVEMSVVNGWSGTNLVVVSSVLKDEKTESPTEDVSVVVVVMVVVVVLVVVVVIVVVVVVLVLVVVLVAISETNEDITVPVEVEDNDEYSLEFDR
jgi:hypothetical protein